MKRPALQPTKIRHWRLFRGLTQDELVDRVQMHMAVTKATISRIENGVQPYSQRLLEVLAVVLDTTPAALLARDPVDTQPIEELWTRADEGQRRQIVAVAEAVVGFAAAGGSKA